MNNKPVAWMSNESFEVSTLNIGRFSIPLYTHPVKELTPLTEDECRAIIEKHNWFAKSWAEMAMEIQDAILRKAQATCNGFCGDYECKENQGICKRKAQEK